MRTAFLGLLLLVGCQHGGRLVVVVESETPVLEVEVDAVGQRAEMHTFLADAGPMGAGRVPVTPFSFVVVPTDASEPVDITVRGYGCDRTLADCQAIERRERARVSPNETRVLRILLSDRCAGMTCAVGVDACTTLPCTCGPNGCENVPTWLDLPVIPPGGEFEAGRPDGGVTGELDAPRPDTPELDAPVDAPEEPDAPVPTDVPLTGFVALGTLSEGLSAAAGYGVAVAVSSHGEVALVSAPGDGSVPGAVYAYRLVGGRYMRVSGPLMASEPGTRLLGLRLALAGLGPWRGLVTAFTTQRVYPIACDSTCALGPPIEQMDLLPFGTSVDLDTTGVHALIGGSSVVIGEPGYVFDYDWTGSTWAENLGGREPGVEVFGSATAAGTTGGITHGDREVVDVGRNVRIAMLTPNASDTTDAVDSVVIGSSTGPVFYAYSGRWIPRDYLGSHDTTNYVSAAISDDGTRAILGEFDLAGARPGSVLVARESGTTWTDERVIDGSSPTENFGFSVALSADSHYALVGAPGGALVYAYFLP